MASQEHSDQEHSDQEVRADGAGLFGGARTPLTMALDAQRELTESATEAVEKARIAPERLSRLQSVEVGQTPSEVVYEENKLELLHYESRTDEQHDVPILVVYALINKPYILDLQPDRSVVRHLLDAGHDVYLIDWNEPSRLDRHLTLDDYVNRYIDNCVDVVRERSGQESINILGYCMGGTMSAMYAALHPEKVRSLGLMAAGLCFAGTGGVLEEWGEAEYYDPRDVVDTFGNVPAEMLDVGFALMDPVSNYVSKYVRLMDNLENEEFVENFARMERWLSEGIDVAGDTYVEFLEDIYQDNKLYNNELTIGGERVDLGNIDMPVLQVVGEYDHLIPPESSKPFNDVVGSDDVRTIEYPTGHIGLSVSGSSHEDVWPEVADWYREKSSEPGVEAIDGIGTTYAERLRAAGIETAADLAVADPDRVADAAEVGRGRAEDWIDQAGDLAGDLGGDRAGDRAGNTAGDLAGDTAGDLAGDRAGDNAHETSAREDEPRPAGADESDGGEEPPGGEESDVETVEGIGPTYADRLREAGIETTADLAAGDAETVAEAADVGTDRARGWIERSRLQ